MKHPQDKFERLQIAKKKQTKRIFRKKRPEIEDVNEVAVAGDIQE